MTNATSTGGPGTAGAAPPPPRRLERRTDDKMVAGVAAGLADHFGVDVTLVRLGIVLLTLTGPGLFAYVGAWILMPEGPVGTPANPHRAGPGLSGSRAVAGAILLTIGCIALLDSWWWWDDGFLFPLALLGVGAVLLFRPRADDPPPPGGGGGPDPRRPGNPDDPGSPDDPGGGGGPGGPGGAGPDLPDAGPAPGAGLAPWTPSAGVPSRVDDPTLTDATLTDATLTDASIEDATLVDPTEVGPAADPTSVPPPAPGGGTAGFGGGDGPELGGFGPVPGGPPPAPARRRERSPLAGVVLGAGLVTAGLGWALAAADVIEPGVGDVLAATLAVLGVGLIVGAWWGRAWWLALLAWPVALALIAVAVVGDGSLAGPWGDQVHRPASADALRDDYRVGIGELTVDLSAVDLRAGQALDVAASVGMGALHLIVPEGVDVVVDASVRAGEIRLPDGETFGGWTVAEQWTDGPPSGRGGRLELDVDTVFGQVVVERG